MQFSKVEFVVICANVDTYKNYSFLALYTINGCGCNKAKILCDYMLGYIELYLKISCIKNLGCFFYINIILYN